MDSFSLRSNDVIENNTSAQLAELEKQSSSLLIQMRNLASSKDMLPVATHLGIDTEIMSLSASMKQIGQEMKAIRDGLQGSTAS